MLFLFFIIPSLSLNKNTCDMFFKRSIKKKSVSCEKKTIQTCWKQRSYIGQFKKKKRPTPNLWPLWPPLASNFSTAGVTSSNWGVWQQQQRYQPPAVPGWDVGPVTKRTTSTSHPGKLRECPRKKGLDSIGSTSSNHWFLGDMLVFGGVATLSISYGSLGHPEFQKPKKTFKSPTIIQCP